MEATFALSLFGSQADTFGFAFNGVVGQGIKHPLAILVVENLKR